jgi:hypothetical protein
MTTSLEVVPIGYVPGLHVRLEWRKQFGDKLRTETSGIIDLEHREQELPFVLRAFASQIERTLIEQAQPQSKNT